MKLINLVPFGFVILGLLMRETALWCTYKIASCPAADFFHTIFPNFLNPIHTFSVFFLLPSLLLAFSTTATLKAWTKFSAWWIPLSIVVIYIGSSGGDGLMPFYSYSPSEVATPMAALFAAISLGIIAWKQFKFKK